MVENSINHQIGKSLFTQEKQANIEAALAAGQTGRADYLNSVYMLQWINDFRSIQGLPPIVVKGE